MADAAPEPRLQRRLSFKRRTDPDLATPPPAPDEITLPVHSILRAREASPAAAALLAPPPTPGVRFRDGLLLPSTRKFSPCAVRRRLSPPPSPPPSVPSGAALQFVRALPAARVSSGRPRAADLPARRVPSATIRAMPDMALAPVPRADAPVAYETTVRLPPARRRSSSSSSLVTGSLCSTGSDLSRYGTVRDRPRSSLDARARGATGLVPGVHHGSRPAGISLPPAAEGISLSRTYPPFQRSRSLPAAMPVLGLTGRAVIHARTQAPHSAARPPWA